MSIGDSAFYNCTSLTNITLPNSVISIGNSAFKNCTLLANVTIGNAVTSVGRSAFYNCTSLTSITLPDSVTSIGEDALSYCTALKTAIIGKGVTTIPEGLLEGCSSLENLTIPFVGGSLYASQPSTSTLFGYIFGDYAKYDGSYNATQSYSSSSSDSIMYFIPSTLSTVTISGGKVLYGAFSQCNSITNIIITAVATIDEHAFAYLSSLKNITIPNSVTSFGIGAFTNCSSLENVYYNGDVEEWLKISFKNHFGNPLSAGANLYCNGELVIDVVIPDSMTSIGAYVFYGCRSIRSLTIPDSVTSIGDSAFDGCNRLASVNLGNSVKTIEKYAFDGCGIITITIPRSVRSIGESAFSGCVSLIEVCNKSSLDIVAGKSGNGSVGYYAKHVITDESQSYLRELGDYVFYDDGTNVYLVGYKGNDREIVLPKYDGGKEYHIGAYAFYRNEEITSAVLPDTVTEIGSDAFSRTSLTTITIPDSVAFIGDHAFAYCTSLTSITIPNSVTRIGFAAFSGCTSLQYNKYDNANYLGNKDNPYLVLIRAADTKITSCEVHSNTKIIYNTAFSNCGSLTSITIPNSVISIGERAFEYCVSLEQIIIPDSVVSMGSAVFSHANPSLRIYIKAKSRPEGWNSSWLANTGSGVTVAWGWGYKG